MTGILTQFEQHTIQIQRLATELLNTHVYPSLGEAYKAAKAIIDANGDITTLGQRNRINREIAKVVDEIMSDGWSGATKQLDAFAVYEASYYAGLIEATAAVSALTIPADEKIVRYINREPMRLRSGKSDTSLFWPDAIKGNTQSMINDYQQAVITSHANGETVRQATKRIQDITEGLSKSEAESLARTGVQHYAVQAREAMHDDNLEVIKAYEYVAVLDNRTTTLCAGRDGNQYKKGKKRPSLPAHWNCRSQYLAIVVGEDDLEGRRTAVGGKAGKEAHEDYEKRRGRMRSTGKVKRRGRKDDSFFDPSQVNANTTYEKWLAKQPEWFVIETLGPKRAALFKRGGMEIKTFNTLAGRKLTLDELRKVDAEAFRRAGL